MKFLEMVTTILAWAGLTKNLVDVLYSDPGGEGGAKSTFPET